MVGRIHKRGIHTESDMAECVKNHLNKRRVIAEKEMRLGACRFDLIACDKNAVIFKVVECKLHSRPASVGRTLGQAITYWAVLKRYPLDFLNSASKKWPLMLYRRWLEATHGGKKIRVAVYVALTDEACRQLDFLEFRAQYPRIGVIGVKPDGHCGNALRRPDGTADSRAAIASIRTISL